MNELVFGADAELSRWVADRIPHVRGGDFGACSAIGVASNGRLLAAVVYHDFQERHATIQLSMASDSPMWARPGTITALLHYPFRQVGAFKLWTAIPLDNAPLAKLHIHLGFKREAILAHHFGKGQHCAIFRMLEPDFTRLFEKEPRHGQKRTKSAAAA